MGRSGRNRWAVRALVAAAVLAVLGAGFLLGRRAPAPRPVSVDTPAVREARALSGRLDALEAELLATLSAVQIGQELARRHESVSLLACNNAVEHLESMRKVCKTARPRRGHARRYADAEPGTAVR